MAGERLDYDFWLFDLDGTLVDVDPDYPRRVLSEVGDRLECTFSEEEMEVVWYDLGGRRLQVLEREGIDPARFWRVFHEVESADPRAAATYLHEDAEFVRDLKVPVGIVTHCQSYLTGPVLSELGIDNWFDTVVCCDDDLGWKPDAAPVYRAMRDLGIVDVPDVATDGGFEESTLDGVLVGDRPGDVGAAWNAGLDGIHVERLGYDYRGRCVLADHRVESFEELPL